MLRSDTANVRLFGLVPVCRTSIILSFLASVGLHFLLLNAPRSWGLRTARSGGAGSGSSVRSQSGDAGSNPAATRDGGNPLAVIPGSASESTNDVHHQLAGQQTMSFGGACVAQRLLLSKPLTVYHDDFNNISMEEWYPFTADMFKEGSHRGNTTRLQGTLAKMVVGEPVHVLVIGGSYTEGSSCYDPLGRTKKGCNWPARFQRWFEAAFPDSPIVMHDESKGGFAISTFLPKLGAMLPQGKAEVIDLVLIDTLVNDAFLGSRFTDQDAVLDTSEKEKLPSIAFEMAVLILREIAPQAQIVLMQGGSRQFKQTQSQVAVANFYNIPVMDYKLLADRYNKDLDGNDRLWPMSASEKPFRWLNFFPDVSPDEAIRNRGSFCCGTLHPPWIVHQYFADHLASVFVDSLESACSAGRKSGRMVESFPEPDSKITFWPQVDLELLMACPRPLTHWSSLQAAGLAGGWSKSTASRNPTVIQGNWSLFADRPGKPGWISDIHGSVIQFPVNVSTSAATSKLSILWLRSYESIGEMYVRAFRTSKPSDVTEWMLFSGSSDDGASQAAFYSERAAKREDRPGTKLMNKSWFTAQSSDHQEVVIEVKAAGLEGGNKVKLLEIISC